MELQASRLGARVGPGGEQVLLLDQDRSRWNRLLIGRGLAALEQAERLSGALGPYTLQAEIAACHARARTGEETEWVRIAALYDALAQVTGSPVVELNRAMAVAMAFGPESGLEIVDGLSDERIAAGLPPAVERARRLALTAAAGMPRPRRRSTMPRGSPGATASATSSPDVQRTAVLARRSMIWIQTREHEVSQ